MCPLDYTAWDGWIPVNRFHHTSLMAVVTPEDPTKSVRNRCVMEVVGGFFVVVNWLLNFLLVHIRVFVI